MSQRIYTGKDDSLFVTRFAGGAASGLPPGPSYQIDSHPRTDMRDLVVMGEAEAEAVCRAILNDIRERRKAAQK